MSEKDAHLETPDANGDFSCWHAEGDAEGKKGNEPERKQDGEDKVWTYAIKVVSTVPQMQLNAETRL
jgi:hypothetical protein